MNKTDKELFTQSVYEIVKAIPYGRATSYGAIAKAVGYPNMSRMVGNVMSKYDSSETIIPAHRVVNSQGALSAREVFSNSDGMQKLLEAEGLVIVNNRIKDWKRIFWNPLKEIQF